MNLPNKLTVMRIILVPFVVAAILIDFPMHFLVAGLLFGAAAITDAFDGKIARKRNLVTDFGKFADPLADKILVIAVLCCFIQLDLIGSIPVIIVLFREFTVTSVRLVAAAKGKVVAANIWGKVKTVTQMVSIVVIFVIQYALEIMKMVNINADTYNMWSNGFLVSGSILIWISTIFAIISGIIYIKDNFEFIKDC